IAAAAGGNTRTGRKACRRRPQRSRFKPTAPAPVAKRAGGTRTGRDSSQPRSDDACADQP
ncbi:MAG: hypothetical protein IKG21_01585, partial [Atopobiaceae bacterium]|nr:hypothetical protein [Atopobiaceae bacterium]